MAGRGEEGAFVLTATARSKRTSLQWSYVSNECEWMYSSCHMLVVLVLVVLVPLVPNAAPGLFGDITMQVGLCTEFDSECTRKYAIVFATVVGDSALLFWILDAAAHNRGVSVLMNVRERIKKIFIKRDKTDLARAE